MLVTQYGLQEAFKRARQQIFAANLPDGAMVQDMICTSGASSAQIQAAQSAAANAVLSQSYLRLIQPLTANLNIFNFPVQVDQPTVNPGEIRLEKQDALFASSTAFYLAKGVSATDVAYIPQTYPNATTWPTGSSLTGGLNTVYNGFLKITINKSVILPAYSMRTFRQVPQTQNGVGITAQTVFPIDQFDPSQVALWEPTINLIGTKQNQWQLVLPSNMTATIEANTFGIFDIFGVLAQNVTLFT